MRVHCESQVVAVFGIQQRTAGPLTASRADTRSAEAKRNLRQNFSIATITAIASSHLIQIACLFLSLSSADSAGDTVAEEAELGQIGTDYFRPEHSERS